MTNTTLCDGRQLPRLTACCWRLSGTFRGNRQVGIGAGFSLVDRPVQFVTPWFRPCRQSSSYGPGGLHRYSAALKFQQISRSLNVDRLVTSRYLGDGQEGKVRVLELDHCEPTDALVRTEPPNQALLLSQVLLSHFWTHWTDVCNHVSPAVDICNMLTHN